MDALAGGHSKRRSFKPAPAGLTAPPRRPSANLAALNGGVQPSLEQLHPDMFFGADDDDATSGGWVD